MSIVIAKHTSKINISFILKLKKIKRKNEEKTLIFYAHEIYIFRQIS